MIGYMAKKKSIKEPTKTITIRMPLDLYDRLEVVRRQETRNMTEQIIHSLKEAVNEVYSESEIKKAASQDGETSYK